MDGYLLKRVAFKLFVLLVYLLPTLLFIDVGVKWADASLYLPLLQGPLVFGDELNVEITALKGSFWRLILAYFIIGVSTASKFKKRKNAWSTTCKIVLTNFCFGLAAGTISVALSQITKGPLDANFISLISKSYFSSYCASMFSIWGQISEPLINALTQVIFAPLILLFGSETIGRVCFYDRLALWSGQFKLEGRMVPPIEPVELGFADNGSNFVLRTRSIGGKAVKPGQKVTVNQSVDVQRSPAKEVDDAIPAKNRKNAEQKVHYYII
jgi:hypothetical protein